MSKAPTGGKRRMPRPTREAFFVRVLGPDDTLSFVNITEHLGKPLPFRKPKATLAMSVSEEAVFFSLLHVTTKSASKVADKPAAIPRGSFAKAQRKLSSLEGLNAETCLVESEDGMHSFRIERDEAGLARLLFDNLDDDEPVIDISGRATQLQLFLWSEAANRPIAVSFIGHLGKPGGSDTLLRAASMALYSLSGLPEFRILTGIDVIDVPPPASRYAATVASRRSAGRAVYALPVWLFTDADLSGPIGSGSVEVEVDLENANPTTNRLLTKLTPSEDLSEIFEPYRATLDGAVMEFLRKELGDEDIATITYDIVLGSVTSGTVARLVDSLKGIGGIDLTETRAKQHAT